MARKRHSAEEIVNKLGEAEVLLAQGTTIAQTCKQIGNGLYIYDPILDPFRRKHFLT